MEKSSAAKDPTDPPSQPEGDIVHTGEIVSDEEKAEKPKPTGEFIVRVVRAACNY